MSDNRGTEFRRTKIVCTLGPSTDRDGVLREMILAGMNAARLNLSHGRIDEHLARMKSLRAAASELGRHVAVMMDTRGPDIRVGELEAPSVDLQKGSQVILTSEPIVGTAGRISVDYRGLIEYLAPGDAVYLHDGLIELKVLGTAGMEARCEVVSGGTLTARKGVNIPGKLLPLPILTDADISDLRQGIAEGIDYILASFVRNAADVEEIRRKVAPASTPIIAKIETASAVSSLEEVLEAADGVMVARGDLGIEIPPESVPGVQKRIIAAARRHSKPVITATEMLLSMVRNPRPTRAEVADVANAVLDGTSAVMLSEETAVGNFPVQAVEFMSRACVAAESDIQFETPLAETASRSVSVRSGIAASAYLLAHSVDAAAIICITDSGRTARLFGRLRPRQPVLACTPDPAVARKLAVHWGILPIIVGSQESVERLLKIAVETGKREGLVKAGDKVVLTGNHSGRGGETDLLAVLNAD